MATNGKRGYRVSSAEEVESIGLANVKWTPRRLTD
jgi:hypothetical protein